jgi:hypothetical protein
LRGYATRKIIGIVALSKDVLLAKKDNVALYTILLGFQEVSFATEFAQALSALLYGLEHLAKKAEEE